MTETTAKKVDVSETNVAKLYDSMSEQDKRMIRAAAKMVTAMIVSLAQMQPPSGK